MNAEHVAKLGNTIGEGPRWNRKERRLYWVDFIGNQHIHSWEPIGGVLQTYETEQPVTALGFRRTGGLIVASRGEIANFSLDARELTPLVTLYARPPMRLNDGAIDPNGRFWVGSMNSETPEEAHGSLYRFDSDGSVHLMDTGFTVSNGLGWSPDRQTFYFTDTFRRVIHAYDFDSDQGAISNRRVFARIDAADGLPDGLAIDAEGHVLSALWGGWKILRFDPDGKLERTIQLPVANPTACTFGGDDLDELYVTSARLGLSPAEIEKQPLAGDLFRVRLGIQGQEEPLFGQ